MSVTDEKNNPVTILDCGGCQLSLSALERALLILNEYGTVTIRNVQPGSAHLIELAVALVEMGRKVVDDRLASATSKVNG